VLGNYGKFRKETTYRLNDLVKAFGATFIDERARTPLQACASPVNGDIKYYGGTTIKLDDPSKWQILVKDADGKPVLAKRTVAKGQILVGSRGLAGQNPDSATRSTPLGGHPC